MSEFFNISLFSVRDLAIPVTGLLMFAVLLFLARPDQAHDRRGVAVALLSVLALIGLYGALIFGGQVANRIAKDALLGPTISTDQSVFSSAVDDDSLFIAAFSGSFLAAIGLLVFSVRTLAKPEFGRHEQDSAARRIEPAHVGTACFLAAGLILTAAPSFAAAAYNIIDDPGRRAGEEALATAIGSGLLLGASLLTLRYYYAGLRDLIFDRADDEDEPDLAELED